MSKPQRGLSLPLWLGAGFVAALGVALLLEALVSSVALSRRAARRVQAERWAHALLEREVGRRGLRTGVSQGHFDGRDRWRLEVSRWPPPLQAADVAGGLLRLDLTVRWRADGPHVLHVHAFGRAPLSAGAAGGAGASARGSR